MKIPQNLQLKDLLYLLLICPVCLVAVALVSALASTASGPAEFILGWDANDEADLDGYEIYYRKGVPGATYKFLAEVYLDELEDPDNPTVTITDLDNGLLSDLITPVVRMTELADNSTYHFALTAFDTQGKTSDFSEELCVEVIGTKVVECGSADNDSESGDGSGGDNDGSAENDADGGSGGGESDGSAENDADGGSGGGESDGAAENDAGSGSGCFIAASSFVFREAVLP